MFTVIAVYACMCVSVRACIQGILERLNAGEVVVGDGGYVMQLERRGYVKAGHWTPEAAVEHPEAGTTLSVGCMNTWQQSASQGNV